jgi:hypothetical protein
MAEAGSGGPWSEINPPTSASAVYVDDTTMIAAYAMADGLGLPSGIRVVWRAPGGSETARRDLEGLSIQGIGLLGIAGTMSAQTMAFFTGQEASRGSLLAAQIRGPGVVEGGESPLAVGVGLRHGSTWKWDRGGIAIAYAVNDRLEVILACEGVP